VNIASHIIYSPPYGVELKQNTILCWNTQVASLEMVNKSTSGKTHGVMMFLLIIINCQIILSACFQQRLVNKSLTSSGTF